MVLLNECVFPVCIIRMSIRPVRGILTVGFVGERTILNEARIDCAASLAVLVTMTMFGNMSRASSE